MINSLSNNDANTTQTNLKETSIRAAVSKIVPDYNEKMSFIEVETEQQDLPAEKVKNITDSLNKLLDTTSVQLRYQYHENLNQYYVTLVDTNNDEVVREIPNKKLLDMYAAMLDFVGVLVDEKI